MIQRVLPKRELHIYHKTRWACCWTKVQQHMVRLGVQWGWKFMPERWAPPGDIPLGKTNITRSQNGGQVEEIHQQGGLKKGGTSSPFLLDVGPVGMSSSWATGPAT